MSSLLGAVACILSHNFRQSHLAPCHLAITHALNFFVSEPLLGLGFSFILKN